MAFAAPHSHWMHARMEAGAGNERRFWEITVMGATVVTRFGRAGTDGRASRPKDLPGPAEARADAEKRIAAKLGEGFTPVVHVIGEHAFEPRLWSAIVDNPDDDSGYLVYADWLQAQGDPRGELAALQRGLAEKPQDARLFRAERQFQKTHGARLLPPRLTEMLRSRGAPDDGACEVEWKLGFVHKAHIGRNAAHPPYTVRELVLALLSHPSAQLLGELVIRALGPGRAFDYRTYDYRPVVEALCQAAPESLQSLFLADFAPEHVDLIDSKLGDVSGLFAAMPRLKKLSLHGGSLELGAIFAPALESFELSTPVLTPAHLDAMDRARWPRLRELTLRGHDEPVDLGALPGLLAGESAPALRTLALTHTTGTRVLWDILTASPLLSRIDVLDLSWGDLSDRDVAAMCEKRSELAHLSALILKGNYISRPYRADVRALCRRVSLHDQRGAAADLPRITQEQIIEFAPDARSVLAAGDVADPGKWSRLGAWTTMVWGSYQGTGHYDVFVDIADMEAGCTCPSSKVPCKHALGLLMLAARGRLLLVQEPPAGFLDACRASRYEAL